MLVYSQERAKKKEMDETAGCKEMQRVDGAPLRCLNPNQGLVERECELLLCELAEVAVVWQLL